MPEWEESPVMRQEVVPLTLTFDPTWLLLCCSSPSWRQSVLHPTPDWQHCCSERFWSSELSSWCQQEVQTSPPPRTLPPAVQSETGLKWPETDSRIWKYNTKNVNPISFSRVLLKHLWQELLRIPSLRGCWPRFHPLCFPWRDQSVCRDASWTQAWVCSRSDRCTQTWRGSAAWTNLEQKHVEAADSWWSRTEHDGNKEEPPFISSWHNHTDKRITVGNNNIQKCHLKLYCAKQKPYVGSVDISGLWGIICENNYQLQVQKPSSVLYLDLCVGNINAEKLF